MGNAQRKPFRGFDAEAQSLVWEAADERFAIANRGTQMTQELGDVLFTLEQNARSVRHLDVRFVVD